MPAHHGQTYDPDEEPAPRGGWFRMEERPFPARLDQAFRWLAVVVAIAGAAALVWLVLTQSARPPSDAAGFGWLIFGTAIAAALAYGFIRGIGLIALALYGAVRDGPEFVVDWRAVRHDTGLRRTWIVLLEGALLLAAASVSVWAGWRFIREPNTFDLAVLALVQTMTYWPLIRRRIAAGRTRG